MSGEVLKQVALPLALFAVLFGMGLSLVPEDFRRVLRHPKAKLVGLTCLLVMLPVIAFALALLFRLPGELAVGLMVLAACPGGATSNVITHLSKGDTALSVTLTAISSMVCVSPSRGSSAGRWDGSWAEVRRCSCRSGKRWANSRR